MLSSSDQHSECNFGNDQVRAIKSLATPLECDHCHSKIPAAVALNFEGVDYIYHFCGPRCIEAWCRATNAHEQ